MQRMLAVVVVALALSAGTAPLSAGESPRLAPGARIRWLSTSGTASAVVGRVAALSSDTLFVNTERGSSGYALPISSLASLEVSRGRQNRSFQFGLTWAVAGGLAAAAGARILSAIGTWAVDEATGLQVEGKDENNYVAIALIGAGIGASAGAVIGSVWPGPERWQPVEVAGGRIGALFRFGGDPALGLSVHY